MGTISNCVCETIINRDNRSRPKRVLRKLFLIKLSLFVASRWRTYVCRADSVSTRRVGVHLSLASPPPPPDTRDFVYKVAHMFLIAHKRGTKRTRMYTPAPRRPRRPLCVLLVCIRVRRRRSRERRTVAPALSRYCNSDSLRALWIVEDSPLTTARTINARIRREEGGGGRAERNNGAANGSNVDKRERMRRVSAFPRSGFSRSALPREIERETLENRRSRARARARNRRRVFVFKDLYRAWITATTPVRIV